MVWLAEPPSFIDQPVTTLLVAQAAPQTEAANQKKRVMGVCTIVNGAGESVYEVKTEISSGFYAREYMYDYEGKDLLFVTNPQTTIIQLPQHGRLAEGWYYPDKGYFGDDTIITKVEENGVVVEVRFFIHVLEYNEADPYYYCGEEVRREFLRQGQGNSWKISIAPNATSNDLAYSLSLTAAFLGADYTSPAVTFANLPGAAVGETKGEGADATITLDTNTLPAMVGLSATPPT
jgi:hypothetical protein